MGSTLFLSRRDPLNSVYARLNTEEVIRTGSVDLKDSLSDAATALSGRRLRDNADRPVSDGGAVGRVHFEKVVGEEGGLGATGARADFEESREVREWVWRDECAG